MTKKLACFAMMRKGVIASQRRGNLGGEGAFRDCFVANAPRNDGRGLPSLLIRRVDTRESQREAKPLLYNQFPPLLDKERGIKRVRF